MTKSPELKIEKNYYDRYGWLLWAFIILVIYGWALKGGLKLSGIQDSAGPVSKSILHGIFHPDWAYVYNGSGEDLVSLIGQTLAIAF